MPVPRKLILLFTLASLPFVVGSSCAVFWSSGSSDHRDRDDEEERFVVVSGGQFGDPAVRGLAYQSGAISGITGESGEFEYEPGETVQFSIGDITLGPPIAATPAMTVEDLVVHDGQAVTSAINIRRLLKSLDVEPEDEAITIPAHVQSSAVMSNDTVAPSIEFLDFSDDDSFTSTASQLVAALTSDYSFTAMLVAADEVKQPATRSVAQ